MYSPIPPPPPSPSLVSSAVLAAPYLPPIAQPFLACLGDKLGGVAVRARARRIKRSLRKEGRKNTCRRGNSSALGCGRERARPYQRVALQKSISTRNDVSELAYLCQYGLFMVYFRSNLTYLTCTVFYLTEYSAGWLTTAALRLRWAHGHLTPYAAAPVINSSPLWRDETPACPQSRSFISPLARTASSMSVIEKVSNQSK